MLLRGEFEGNIVQSSTENLSVSVVFETRMADFSFLTNTTIVQITITNIIIIIYKLQLVSLNKIIKFIDKVEKIFYTDYSNDRNNLLKKEIQ